MLTIKVKVHKQWPADEAGVVFEATEIAPKGGFEEPPFWEKIKSILTKDREAINVLWYDTIRRACQFIEKEHDGVLRPHSSKVEIQLNNIAGIPLYRVEVQGNS